MKGRGSHLLGLPGKRIKYNQLNLHPGEVVSLHTRPLVTCFFTDIVVLRFILVYLIAMTHLSSPLISIPFYK